MDKSTNVGNIRKLLEVAERHGLGTLIDESYCVTYRDGLGLDVQGDADGLFADLSEEIVTPLLSRGWLRYSELDPQERKYATIAIEEGGVQYYFRVSRW